MIIKNKKINKYYYDERGAITAFNIESIVILEEQDVFLNFV